jgi:hypothetical protein
MFHAPDFTMVLLENITKHQAIQTVSFDNGGGWRLVFFEGAALTETSRILRPIGQLFKRIRCEYPQQERT